MHDTHPEYTAARIQYVYIQFGIVDLIEVWINFKLSRRYYKKV